MQGGVSTHGAPWATCQLRINPQEDTGGAEASWWVLSTSSKSELRLCGDTHVMLTPTHTETPTNLHTPQGSSHSEDSPVGTAVDMPPIESLGDNAVCVCVCGVNAGACPCTMEA